jgi:Transposase zinc-ribbon domain
VPVAGRDYPGSYAELLGWFRDEEACVDYLEWLRWPDGFRCRRCVSRSGWRLSTARWECSVCGEQSSVTAGTMFDRTRTPLRMWFAAAWMMTKQKHGVSALGVQRALGAWLLPDGVGDAAPLPERDGAPGTRASDRPGRG